MERNTPRKRVTATLNPDAEHEEQVALYRWKRLHQGRIPQLKLLFAIPNEMRGGALVRHYMVAEGLQAGVPDNLLAVARGGYHGLYVELKAVRIRVRLETGRREEDPGRVSSEQEGWIRALLAEGYAVAVCWGWESARDVVLAYLHGRYVQRPAEELLGRPGRSGASGNVAQQNFEGVWDPESLDNSCGE